MNNLDKKNKIEIRLKKTVKTNLSDQDQEKKVKNDLKLTKSGSEADQTKSSLDRTIT